MKPAPVEEKGDTGHDRPLLINSTASAVSPQQLRAGALWVQGEPEGTLPPSTPVLRRVGQDEGIIKERDSLARYI